MHPISRDIVCIPTDRAANAPTSDVARTTGAVRNVGSSADVLPDESSSRPTYLLAIRHREVQIQLNTETLLSLERPETDRPVSQIRSDIGNLHGLFEDSEMTTRFEEPMCMRFQRFVSVLAALHRVHVQTVSFYA